MLPIARVASDDEHLAVWLDGWGEPVRVPWRWVRDHSHDDASFDPETQQRRVDTFSIDSTISPRSVALRDGIIEVEWADGSPISVLPASLFGVLDGVSTAGPAPVFWDSPVALSIVPVPFEEVMDSPEGLNRWLTDIAVHGFGLVSGVPCDQAGAQSLAERIGYVRRTIFGDMWTLSSEVVAHADSAYGADLLEPHTDGTYSHDGPGMQLFACGERTGTGGESVLVDGFAAANRLRDANPDAFELLSRVEVPSHYIESGVELRASRPTIRLNPDGSILQITFNNYDRSPFVLPPEEMRAWYDAYSELHDLLVDQDAWWTHRLEPGEALIFDNWRCLHGRLAYTGIRVFHGCYLNHEDLESRHRVTNS